jgi:NCAIR mutase (PurE)-related protein
MATRVTPEAAAAVVAAVTEARYLPLPRAVVVGPPPAPDRGRGPIAVLSAGTADVPVAEEAALTAELAGNAVERVYDVGVAGLHRLMVYRETLERAEVIVVAAGMEGALPSVVGGLFARPVIAVPTSVGYGASFGGVAALLSMLNSCAPGIAVVNIDNGFGAGQMAAMINRKRDR